MNARSGRRLTRFRTPHETLARADTGFDTRDFILNTLPTRLFPVRALGEEQFLEDLAVPFSEMGDANLVGEEGFTDLGFGEDALLRGVGREGCVEGLRGLAGGGREGEDAR